MAKSALAQLEDQIAAVRREAFAAGYAAAMQVIQKATAQPPASAGAQPAPSRRRRSASARPAKPTATAAPPARRRRGRPAKTPAKAASRPRRGTNAQLISEVLQAVAPRAVRPAEIRTALQRDKGVAMAFTSIRHALGQLEARKAVEQVGDGRNWRHRT
jgi:hypothetical protein